MESRGWSYEVWSDPLPAELENARFLAGYRRDWLFDVELLEDLRGAYVSGIRLGQAVRCQPDSPEPLVRAALLHLLWAGYLTTDLDRPLCSARVLRPGRAS